MFEPVLVDRYAGRAHPMHVAKPTAAQAEAGNYRMAHTSLHGLDITIETPKGRRRRPEWPPMAAHYGYLKRTMARDGDNLDVFIGPNRSSELVFVIDQAGKSGTRFDEHKIMLGYDSQAEAIAAYRACYTPGWTVGKVTAMTIGQFKAWLKSGDHMKPLAGQVSRYSEERDDLYLAPDAELERYQVERYEWVESDHPRHEAGSPGSIGGQFSSTGEQTGANRPGGSLSPRMLAGAQEKWQSGPNGWEVVGGGAPAAQRSTRLREVAALPDNIKPGHALHLSALSNRDRFDLMDWSRRLHDAMEKVQGPNEEEAWSKVNKNYIRAMLDEMNKRDREARGRGVRLSDYINANGLIPEALAARLQGGKRFFDPEHIRDKLKAGAPTPEEAKATDDAAKKRRSVLDEFKFGDRSTRKAMLSSESDVADIIYQAMGLLPSKKTAAAAASEPAQVKSPLPQPELVKETPESFTSSTSQSLFETLSKAHQKKVDAAIKGDDSDMPTDMVADLREHVLGTWKQLSEQTNEHNNALRQVMTNFGKHWGLVSARLKKGADYDQIRGFDQMAGYARAHFPQLLGVGQGESDSGSDEERLAKALKEGLRGMPNPWDRSVIEAAQQQMAPAMAGEELTGYSGDPNDPEYVPFSVRAIVAEVMRYWNQAETIERFCA